MNKAIKYTKKYLYSVGVGISTLLAAILGAPPSISLCGWLEYHSHPIPASVQHQNMPVRVLACICRHLVQGIDYVFKKTTGENNHCLTSWLAYGAGARSAAQLEMNFHD